MLLKGLFLSFYSRDFYYQVARVWKGIGIGYILLLSLILSLGMTSIVMIKPQVWQTVDLLSQKVKTLPALTIVDGHLSIDEPVPYRINFSRTPGQNAWFVIDTSYKMTDIDVLEHDMRQNNIVMFATDDHLVTLKNRDRHLEIYDFKKIQSFSVSHDTWNRIGKTMMQWGFPAMLLTMFVGLMIGLTIMNFLATFFLAIIVLLVGLLMRAQLDFAASMRLSSAIRVPVNLITYLGMLFPLLWIPSIVSWAIWMVYLLFATWSSRPKVLVIK
jgi:Protein of unknown function (DUF1189)